MRSLLLSLALIPTLCATAQKTEERMDERFKPATYNARYYVVTEKKDSLWHRQAWYLPELGMAMDAWYRDKECRVAHGVMTWYHPDRTLKSTGSWVEGKRVGTWMAYHPNGMVNDSATYVDGKLRGIRLGWYSNGSMSDSTQFDEAGNGVEVHWYKEGNVYSAGRWTGDTLKKGRWQYYHLNGKIRATEDFEAGKRVAAACYDSTGKQLGDCEEREATFTGGVEKWRRFLERNLNASVPVKQGAPVGAYTVLVQFIVDKDGSISDVKALTNHGYGMEEEVLRLIRKGPKWTPARQFGSMVKAYRKQPITFVVQEGAYPKPKEAVSTN